MLFYILIYDVEINLRNIYTTQSIYKKIKILNIYIYNSFFVYIKKINVYSIFLPCIFYNNEYNNLIYYKFLVINFFFADCYQFFTLIIISFVII